MVTSCLMFGGGGMGVLKGGGEGLERVVCVQGRGKAQGWGLVGKAARTWPAVSCTGLPSSSMPVRISGPWRFVFWGGGGVERLGRVGVVHWRRTTQAALSSPPLPLNFPFPQATRAPAGF
jgi:hypothetical protein